MIRIKGKRKQINEQKKTEEYTTERREKDSHFSVLFCIKLNIKCSE